MAIFHLTHRFLKRSSGASSISKAAYNAGQKIEDNDGSTEYSDYTRKGGVLYDEIMLPSGSPSWANERGELWRRLEAREDKSTRRADAVCLLDPFADNRRRARQRLSNSFCQRLLLLGSHLAGPPFVPELRQPLQALLLINFVPISDSVIVHVENFCNRLTTQAVVKEEQRIRPSCYPAFRFPIPHNGGEFGSDRFIKKNSADHTQYKNPSPNPRQAQFFGSLWNRGVMGFLGYMRCNSMNYTSA